ncbi:MAG: hypothetical protein NTX57_20935 [Armatimonadetes bacterium]|nr:hypothetical protein [Armatimonadota bacterium]
MLYVKPALAQGGPTGGGTSGNSYPCLSNVTITNGYRCANDQGVAYNYPQVYKTHLDESNNTVVDHQDPMAAKIGTTLNVTLNVTRSTLAQNNYTGTLTITAMYFTQGGIVFVPCDNVTPLSNLMPGFSADVTFSLGALPNYVTKGDLVIFFNGDGYIDGMYEETLYLVYNQPAAPQAIPWIGVLEDACIFAHGQSSDMTVSKELTFGVFFGGNFGVQSKRYFKATGIPHHIDMGWGPVEGDHKFLLTEFLSIQGETLGNCVDVSTYLAICANALGLNFSLGNYKETNNAVFYTNNMNFIGMNGSVA